MYNKSFLCNSKYNKKKGNMIIDYYRELYENYDMKTIPEIASELEIGVTSLRYYIDALCNGKNSEGKYSKINLMILLCTKFGYSSPYYGEQKELSSIIKRREIVKLLKEHQAKQYKK